LVLILSFFLLQHFLVVIEKLILKDLNSVGKEGRRKTMKNLTSSEAEREKEKKQQKIK
jgi:hypothetical protein